MSEVEAAVEVFGKNVVLEAVQRELETKLIIPEMAKNKGIHVDIFVRAIGDDVDGVSVGDMVITPLPTNDQMFKIDIGDGEKVYMIFDESEIIGKYK